MNRIEKNELIWHVESIVAGSLLKSGFKSIRENDTPRILSERLVRSVFEAQDLNKKYTDLPPIVIAAFAISGGILASKNAGLYESSDALHLCLLDLISEIHEEILVGKLDVDQIKNEEFFVVAKQISNKYPYI